MANRLRPLRVLIPVGVLSGCAVALRAAQPSEDVTSGEGIPDSEPLSTSFAAQLEGEVHRRTTVVLLRTDLPDKREERREQDIFPSQAPVIGCDDILKYVCLVD